LNFELNQKSSVKNQKFFCIITNQLYMNYFLSILSFALFTGVAIYAQEVPEGRSGTATGFSEPVSVYCNWSAYDELSDSVKLTEALAMRELDEILRLRKSGVRVDYYLMDAFWFEPKGAYRRWRVADWPDRWMEACKANGLKPGL
jgi:hypothetical protein